MMRFLFLTIMMSMLIGCATTRTPQSSQSPQAPDLPASAYTTQSATPNMDYMYRSPPPAVVNALVR